MRGLLERCKAIVRCSDAAGCENKGSVGIAVADLRMLVALIERADKACNLRTAQSLQELEQAMCRYRSDRMNYDRDERL